MAMQGERKLPMNKTFIINQDREFLLILLAKVENKCPGLRADKATNEKISEYILNRVSELLEIEEKFLISTGIIRVSERVKKGE